MIWRRLVRMLSFSGTLYLLLSITGGAWDCTASPRSSPHEVWQNIPVIALLNGGYAGTVTVGDARKHGDLGIGAFGELDGEMLEIAGKLYQVTADGKVRTPGRNVLLSYALMTHFHSEQSVKLPDGTTFSTLKSVILPQLATQNAFYSVRMTGRFKAVTTRSLPKQRVPYPPFCVVQKTQPTFDFKEIQGTMVGFFGPSYIGNLDTAGFHLHFLAQDRSGGGHVLSFTAGTVFVELDRIDQMVTGFPRAEMFEKANLDKVITCE